MLKTGAKPTTKELVTEKYPNAFADDEGGYIVIFPTEGLHQYSTQQELNENIIGRGETESAAWEDAAISLGLM